MRALVDAQRAELHADFAFNDMDEDGYIDFNEFGELMKDLQAGMSARELQIGFHAIDTDKNGKIDFDEFADWWQGR